jgi:phenylpropionate dioxygenase-like ring-hydroxylating dioxygenase large terminal subunit
VTDTAPPTTLPDLRDLIKPDEGLVNSRVYVDPEIFEMEMQKIWRTTWLYAGHVSEIANPGDYVTRRVGMVPVILTRTKDNEVKALINQCRHRGNAVCAWERGNSAAFRCPYHFWTFASNGELLGVPYPKNYGPDFKKADYSLHAVARVAFYRGFIFISHAPSGPTLEDHLGHAAQILDWAADLSPTGELEVRVGHNSTRIAANWKMYIENASDQYHGEFVHDSSKKGINEEARKQIHQVSGDQSRAVFRSLGNGHTQPDFRAEYQSAKVMVTATTRQVVADPDQLEYRKGLVDRLGEERAGELLRSGYPSVCIFPNMFLHQQDIRRVEPASPTEMLAFQQPYMLAGAPESINLVRLRRHESTYGPAGIIMSDDMEIFERCQHALRGKADEWLIIARGIHREQVDENGNVYSHIGDETAMRGMWRGYLQAMEAAA